MAIELLEELDGKLATVKVSGKLTKQDYERFVPEIETLIEKNGKIDLLLIMHEFHGWDAVSLWEDIKFDLKHFGDIRRLAVVGESKWEKWMASFCKPFTKAHIKYFEQEQVALARLWVQLKDERTALVIPHSKPAAFGIYTTRAGVEKAVEQLKSGGYTTHEISVLLPQKSEPPHVSDNKSVEAAGMGAGIGAIAGGVLGWVLGFGGIDRMDFLASILAIVGSIALLGVYHQMRKPKVSV